MRAALVKMAITFIGSVMLAAVDAGAATNVSGPLSASQTWTAAGNPYILTGDVTVPSGMTLTIEPGVNIRVSATDDTASGDATRVDLIINGALVVNGTAAAPVTFAPIGSTGPGSWSGIMVGPGSGTVTITHASVGGGMFGLLSERPGQTVTVNHAHFYDVSFAGILVTDGTPHILATLVTGPGNGGPEAGIRTVDSGQAIIANCVIAGFMHGIDLQPAITTTTFVSNNTIVGSGSTGLRVMPETGTSLTAIVTNNIVNSFLPGAKGIEVVSAPGVVVTLSHNNVTGDPPYTGIAPGPGSLSVYPEYVSATDFHLAPGSPMIDAGTGPTNVPLVDFDDVPRPQGAGFDIGAYEFLPVVAPIAPPTANAGLDQTFTAGPAGTASVTLTGIGTGPTGSVLSFRWTEGAAELATTATFTHTFTTGVHLLTFRVTDQYGQFATDTVLIGVLAGGGTGTPGPQGNSVTITPDTTVCMTGGVKLAIVD